MCAMKNSARRWSAKARAAWSWGSWASAALALVMVAAARCSGGSPDPLLAPGEQALVGSYKLDHVLLAPGKLVILPNSNPLFADMGDTLEQAAQKGSLNATQLAVLKRQDCTMTVLADHSFVITNLPSADLTQTFSMKGTWSMEVYHVFETYGYRIALKCPGHKGPALDVKFFNADKPNPPVLQIFYGDGKKDTVVFRVMKANWQPGSRRSR
jgi:hypothetical protein